VSVALVDGSRTVSCDLCDKEITDGKTVCCLRCLKRRIDEEVEEAEALAKTEESLSAENLRNWANRQKLMGSITREVFEALERAADDIEAGWPL